MSAICSIGGRSFFDPSWQGQPLCRDGLPRGVHRLCTRDPHSVQSTADFANDEANRKEGPLPAVHPLFSLKLHRTYPIFQGLRSVNGATTISGLSTSPWNKYQGLDTDLRIRVKVLILLFINYRFN